MTARTLLDRLHDAAIRVQLPIVLAAIPFTTVAHATVVASLPSRAAVSLLAASVCISTIAASLLLRGSLRSTVDRLQVATDAIAEGDFRHRIRSGRSDELGQLAASIDVMAERLERLEQVRRRLLACVSHELRTPLTIIQGHAYTLARHEDDVIRRDRLELVQVESTRLARLVGDLVEAASLHAGGVRLHVESCDLAALVEGEVARFEEEAAMRDLRFDLSIPTRALLVDADPVRISQSVANLLANAMRHAPPGSVVFVHVGVDGPRGGGSRSIHVTNECEPISDDVADLLFEPFVQGESRTGSVGLGLAIVHAIVTAHGGNARLDRTAAARGVARFTIELPQPHRTPRARPTRNQVLRRSRSPRALVVEP